MRNWSRTMLGCTLVAVLGLYPLLAPPAHRIDQAHAARIVNGMTMDQVEAIFGVPAGGYDWAEPKANMLVLIDIDFLGAIQFVGAPLVPDEPTVDLHFPNRVAAWSGGPSWSWTSRHGFFSVAFDPQGRVVSTGMSDEVRIVPPWWAWWQKAKNP